MLALAAIEMSTSPFTPSPFFPGQPPSAARRHGFRFVASGVHTSRTIMLAELSAVLDATPPSHPREAYSESIVGDNALGKATAANRRKSRRYLAELYSLDPEVPAFALLRRLWPLDQTSRPRLALLLALARDPLLLAGAGAILPLATGEELQRDRLRAALGAAAGERLSPATLEKVARNVASSFTQSGHLTGRTFKRRALVTPTPVAVAYALSLATAAGYLGRETITSGWVRALDASPLQAQELAIEAKRLGLIELRIAGGVFDLGFTPISPPTGTRYGRH